MEEDSTRKYVPTTSITSLSDDCLFIIFQLLDCLSDRESFGLTCRRWLRVQNLCRRTLQFSSSFTHLSLVSLSHPNFDTNSTQLARLLGRFRHLESLSLSGCIKLLDSSLAALRHPLRAIHFDCCSSLTDLGFSVAFESCPSLTTVSLYRCNVTDLGLAKLAGSCPGLTQLNLSYCSEISDRGLSALSRACRRLRAVRVSFSGGITGSGLAGCPPSLAYLEAASCDRLDPEGLRAAASGGGLEYLDVSSPGRRIAGDCLAILGTAGVGSRIRVLNLRLCREIRDGSVSAVAKGCPELREWNLARCSEVKLPGWESVGAFCGNLERLHVNGCRGLCDRGLLALRNGCPRLTVMYMTPSVNITSTAIEVFKFNRSEVVIKEEEVMCIGPEMPFR